MDTRNQRLQPQCSSAVQQPVISTLYHWRREAGSSDHDVQVFKRDPLHRSHALCAQRLHAAA